MFSDCPSVHPSVRACIRSSPNEWRYFKWSQLSNSKYSWNRRQWESHWFKDQGQSVMTENNLVNAVTPEPMKRFQRNLTETISYSRVTNWLRLRSLVQRSRSQKTFQRCILNWYGIWMCYWCSAFLHNKVERSNIKVMTRQNGHKVAPRWVLFSSQFVKKSISPVTSIAMDSVIKPAKLSGKRTESVLTRENAR